MPAHSSPSPTRGFRNVTADLQWAGSITAVGGANNSSGQGQQQLATSDHITEPKLTVPTHTLLPGSLYPVPTIPSSRALHYCLGCSYTSDHTSLAHTVKPGSCGIASCSGLPHPKCYLPELYCPRRGCEVRYLFGCTWQRAAGHSLWWHSATAPLLQMI